MDSLAVNDADRGSGRLPNAARNKPAVLERSGRAIVVLALDEYARLWALATSNQGVDRQSGNEEGSASAGAAKTLLDLVWSAQG